ncbi:ESPR-type extended signal peptide-containing protein [uncultured Megasphaera sp.]|uniref:ESPR-type extended signal peptide-containing protein n=1 Tax=uncultured Megasphaera sp. TaxID=165188 RepID=UPI002592B907|nr:ESPR-type extended signal peptide-containing protein [uncultured Megasphaera sp.]
MNKVYQVIWSRVRHCYMAVAETVARSHYKHSSKSAAKATWAAVAAAGLLTGIPAFSMAQGSTIAAPNQVVRTAEGQALTKDNGKAKKAATPVFSNKELKKLTERVTFPMNFMVTDGGTDGVYVTEQRYNNDLKGEHIVLGEGSVAFDRQKGYSGLFAAGINAVAGGKDAIAIGNQASATGNTFSIAIGSNAEAPMSNSIALGEGSIANLTLSQQGKQSYLTKEDWNGDYNGVLSLGRDLSGARAEVTRRIIHVAGGAEDTDAVNVKQLKALEAKIPKAVDLSKYTTTDKLGAVIEQKLGDTYAKKADIPAAKTFKAVGDGISVTEKDNVITYTLDTSKLPQSSTGVYVTEQRYNNDLKGEHIVLGEGSVAFDQQKGYSGLFAAGINAVAGGKDAIAIGNKASATGNTFSIAIGSNAEAPMSNSIALGEGSIANLTLSQQGKQSYLTKEDWNGDYNGVLSLGRDLSGARAEVTRRIIHVAGGAADTDAVNVKQLKALEATLHFSYISIKGTKKDKGTNYNNDGATGNEAIAIGQESQATGNLGIAIGVHSKVMGLENNNLIKGDYGTAIGAWASVKNNDATALGAHTHAWGERSLAIGDRSVGNGIESVAIGSQALADSFNAIAIGGNSSANLENAIAIGKKSKTEGMTSIAIGSEASTGQKGDAQKSKERVKELKNDVRKQLNDPIIHKAENAIAIGTQAKAWQTKAVSLGAFAKAQERESLALGDKSFANGIESVAIGHNSSAQHISAIALGDSSLSEGIQSIAIGKNAQAGNKDEAFKSKQQLKKLKSEHKDITNDDIINASFGAIAIGSGAKSLAMHAMSLGLNAKATAVNSIALGFNSEAKSVTHVTKAYGVDETWDFSNGVLSIGRDAEENKKAITRRITHIASGGDDYDAVNVKQLKAVEAKIPKAVDLSKYTPTDKLGDVIAQKLGDTYAKKTDIPAAKTFKVAGAGFSVEDKDNVVTYTLDINKLKTQLSGSSSAGTNGKSAYEVWEEYTDGNGAQPNKGKKESDFLASLKGKDGTNGTNGKSAYEVWEEHKDVNGAQPNKGKSESDFLASLKGKDGTNGITAAQLEQVSQGMQTRMAALGKHMNSMGAGNAALAALHPLEFDPDDKLEAAVGVGHYGDANAAALGMFYHPDENTLISVGGAFGKDKNVMNAGISFRVGKGGNGMLLTKTALATAVKQQNIVIHQQEERIRQLERENKARDAKLAEVLQALAQVKR